MLPSGLNATPSVDYILDSFSSMGFDATPNRFQILPRAETFSRQASPASTRTNSDVDLPALFSSSLRIKDASEDDYNTLIGAMSTMGLS